MAREAGDDGLVAEALNTAGGIDLLDERFGEWIWEDPRRAAGNAKGGNAG